MIFHYRTYYTTHRVVEIINNHISILIYFCILHQQTETRKHHAKKKMKFVTYWKLELSRFLAKKKTHILFKAQNKWRISPMICSNLNCMYVLNWIDSRGRKEILIFCPAFCPFIKGRKLSLGPIGGFFSLQRASRG